MKALLIFEPHHGFGGNDPDGNPWPFGYISEGCGSPIFELGVPVVASDCPKLRPLALKLAAAEEMFDALEWIGGHDAAANGLSGFAADLVNSLAGMARDAVAKAKASV